MSTHMYERWRLYFSVVVFVCYLECMSTGRCTILKIRNGGIASPRLLSYHQGYHVICFSHRLHEHIQFMSRIHETYGNLNWNYKIV